MAREKDGESLRDYRNRKKRYQRRKIVLITLVMLILVAAGAIYLFMLYNRTYQSYEVIATTANTEENIAGYLEYEEGMVRFSKDGAVAFDKNGKLLWNGSYEMLDPIADTSGKYVVIADRGGKAIQIFNEKGQAGTLNMDYDITKVQIAAQGIVAVLMWDGETNFVKLFDREGTEHVAIKTVVQKDGYPMDIALSDDGRKLGVVLLSVNKGKVANKVGFYNFGEVGQSLSDRWAGGYLYDEEDYLVPRIVFLDNNTVCAYKDNGFILYSVPEKPEEIKEETFEQQIKSILHNEKYTGVVLEEDGDKASRLLLYDLKGNQVLDKKLTMDYNDIYISKDEIIMYDNLSIVIMKTSGRVKLESTFQSNISAIFPINYLDRYFLVNANEILDIKLVE